MALTRPKKWCVVLAVVLIVLFFVLPWLLGLFLRGTVESGIADTIKAPVKLGGLSLRFVPPGLVLTNLEISGGGKLPLVKTPMLKASVSFGSILGGDLHVTGITISGAQASLACDDKGRSLLVEFLEAMEPSERTKPLPIDELVVKDSHAKLFVPQKLLAPNSGLLLDPATVEVGSLRISGLVLPVPGQRAGTETWGRLVVDGLKLRAPIRDVPAPVPIADAGPPLEEGVTLDRASLRFALPTTTPGALRVEDARIEGLKVRNVLTRAGTPETLRRLVPSLALCLVGAPTKEKEPAAPGLFDGVYVTDLATSGSALEVFGPDGNGKPCFWRLTDLKAEVKSLPLGAGADTPAEKPGLLRIASPSKSSEGDGQLTVEWKGVHGTWPELDFECLIELTGLALTPVSVRVEETADAGIGKGQMAASFAGPTQRGRLQWDGSVTLSKDTQLAGRDISGSIVSAMSRVATGEPIRTIRIRGTLTDPDVAMPDFVAGAVKNMFEKAILGGSMNMFGAFGEGMGAAVQQGMRQTGRLIEKIPGLGGILGGDEKK
jgi:hypothetical protein